MTFVLPAAPFRLHFDGLLLERQSAEVTAEMRRIIRARPTPRERSELATLTATAEAWPTGLVLVEPFVSDGSVATHADLCLRAVRNPVFERLLDDLRRFPRRNR